MLFRSKLAKELGLKEAIVFEYIKLCISQENEEGWSRITYDQIKQRLTFMSKKNIERVVKSLCDQRAIVKQNKTHGQDRANWYAISNK